MQEKRGNRSEVEYRLAWARTLAKALGLIVNSERGVWALPAGLNVLRLLPPLVIEQADLERVVEGIGEVLE